MAAEFDNTSFGMQRRRRDALELTHARHVVSERIQIVKDAEKMKRLEVLRDAIDDVLLDLNT